MSFRPSPADRPPPGRPALRLPRWPRYLVPVVAGLIALGVLVTIIAGVWTDWLWYRSVDYGSVFGVTYGTRWALFFVVGIFMAATIGFNAVLAFRLRPVYRPAAATERPGVDAFRAAVDPHRRLLLGIVLGLIGLISGITASSAWRTWLLFINQVPFGRRDPQFNLDISFFVFTYPFLRLLLSYLFAAVFLSLLAAVGVHVLYGGLGWQARRPRATMATQAHLFVLLGVFVLLKGVAYWVDRWGIDFSQRGAVTTGASYTDVNAVLPAKTVLAVIAILCALLFFAGRAAAQRAAPRGRAGPAGAVGDPDRRRLPGDHPAVRGQAERACQGVPVHPPGDHPDPAGLRGQQHRRASLQRDQHPDGGHSAQRVVEPARVPADGPGRGLPCVPAAPAGQGVLPVPRHAVGGPVRAAR